MLFEFLSLGFLSGLLSFNFTATLIILVYFRQKPVGMQTLFDKLVSSFLFNGSVLMITLSTVAYLSTFPLPLNKWQASMLYYINNFFFNSYFLWFLTIGCFQYVCIFCPTFVEFEKSDKEIAQNIRLFNSIFLLLISIVENGVIVNVENVTVFQSLTDDSG